MSSARVNVLWGFANFVVAFFLLRNFDLRRGRHALVSGAGVLAMALVSAWTFGRFYGGR